ncbi:MAG: outer membrane beta-barrel protein [Candidatus Eisenbacteria bacterium]
MKRNISILFLASLLVASVVFAPVAFAGPVGTLEVNAGYAKSSTELGTTTESLGGGIGFGASYWRGVSPSVSLGGEVSLDNLGNASYSGVDLLAGAFTEDFDTTVFRVNPAVRVNFGAPVGPSFYGQGGVGLYKVSSNYSYEDVLGIVNFDGSESKIGFNFGAGVNFPVAPTTKMNVGLQYHSVSTEGQSTNYVNLRAGIGFSL